MAKTVKTGQVNAMPALPQIQPGKYADGLPYDEIRFLECKLILKPNHFTSRASLFDFAKVLRRPAKDHGVIFEPCTLP